ncbi:MAG TPA: twin-arginine translocase subunit TatC [Gammaproteobacteria bacterium]|nr:twin-arginine translocase subunit TatC [Gammaproteobacteria bacterium]
MSGEQPAGDAREAPLIAHLLELRQRLMIVIGAVVVLFLLLVPFANELFTLFAQPLIRQLPPGSSLIAVEVATPFLIPFKLAFVTAVFLAMPVALYQAWAFIAPGLYQQERRFVLPLLVSSVLLFYAGVAFAYFAVFPLVFGFFAQTAPAGVTVMPDMASYLDFALALFFAFGLAFETPVATVLLVKMGIMTPARLAAARSWVLIGAFVVGAILTPPDVLSQTLLAVPMYLLYEIGIVLARLLVPQAKAVELQRGE